MTSLEAATDTLPATVLSVANPISVAALPDGTRAYISSATVSGGSVASKVTVINTSDFSIKTTIRFNHDGSNVCAESV